MLAQRDVRHADRCRESRTPCFGNDHWEELAPELKTIVDATVRANIQVRTLDREGRVAEHVDVHSLRRTFATELIVNGTDPKTVQELLGHKTLAMTMNLYAKVHTGTKRQAVGRLSYGRGVQAPDHLLELPSGRRSVPSLATGEKRAAGGSL